MKSGEPRQAKLLYARLRALPWRRLWDEEAPRFNQAGPKERTTLAPLVRAVGVVAAESAPPAERELARQWLRALLKDPDEKIRRYAIRALPKLGVGAAEETQLLELAHGSPLERERRHLSRALEKVGGQATLQALQSGAAGLSAQTLQKLQARAAREQSPSALQLDAAVADFAGLRIHLRGRRGLENLVRQEAEETLEARARFRVVQVGPGLVALEPLGPFSLKRLYTLRCFDTVGFALGFAPNVGGAEDLEAMAALIASPLSRRLFGAMTSGAIRYRLNYETRGHQRGLFRQLADKVHARCPEILNDAQRVTWTVDIRPAVGGCSLELSPHVAPDPRFAYRLRLAPASSHAPLAACLARLAGQAEGDVAWDPFCGSGAELIERSFLGGAHALIGSDRDPVMLEAARANFQTLGPLNVKVNLIRGDFRDSLVRAALREDGGPTVILTNPPMGRRVPIGDLRRLMGDFFRMAAEVLRPGGRLALANPLPVENLPPTLKLQSSQLVDLGGFDCRLELYRKTQR